VNSGSPLCSPRGLAPDRNRIRCGRVMRRASPRMEMVGWRARSFHRAEGRLRWHPGVGSQLRSRRPSPTAARWRGGRRRRAMRGHRGEAGAGCGSRSTGGCRPRTGSTGTWVRPQIPGFSPGGLGPHLTASGFPSGLSSGFPFAQPGSSPSSAFLRFPFAWRSPVRSLRPSLSGSVPRRFPPGSLPLEQPSR
jgi:hypothetical protein